MIASQNIQELGSRLTAIGSVCKRACIEFNNSTKKWVVSADELRTRTTMTEDMRSGSTPMEAIENTWINLTHDPSDGFPEGKSMMPADQNYAIVNHGRNELWMQWDGFRWVEKFRQKSQ